MFEHMTPYAGDPVLALVNALNANARPHKVDLSIGIYFDKDGRLPVLGSVQQAEARISAAGGAKPYLQTEGNAAAHALVQRLLDTRLINFSLKRRDALPMAGRVSQFHEKPFDNPSSGPLKGSTHV